MPMRKPPKAVHGHITRREWLRFMQKVDIHSCWEWQARKHTTGYGILRFRRKIIRAYQFSYIALRGNLPYELVLDHLCRNPICVNPWHLELVSDRINILRGIGPTAMHARKTHCLNGHLFDEKNTFREMTKEGTLRRRRCRACNRAQYQRRKAGKDPLWQEKLTAPIDI